MIETERIIEYSKVAKNALMTLDISEQQKARRLINKIAESTTNDFNMSNVSRLNSNDRNLIAIKLNAQLRIIVELHEDKIDILDILNYGLYERYFRDGKRYS